MSIGEVQLVNSHNIETLEAIIDSIDIYLNWLQENSLPVDYRNKEDNIRLWKSQFAVCKKNLSNCITAIEIDFTNIILILKKSEPLLQKMIEIFMKVPASTKNTVVSTGFKEVVYNNTSSDEIIKAIKEFGIINHNTYLKDIPDRLTNLQAKFENYNNWIYEAEINKTANLAVMGPLESFLKDLFQNNRKAQNLRSYIIERKFYNIRLEPTLIDEIKKLEL